jgi:phosphatidylglycerophosphate synthase
MRSRIEAVVAPALPTAPLLPNLATGLRILLTVLLHFLLDGDRILFLAVLGVAAATDALDGWLARRLRQQSAFGRTFDSVADSFLFCSAVWWLWKLQPAIFLDHPAQWTLTAICAAAPQLAALMRLRRHAGFHLYTAKVTGAWALFCFYWALLEGYQPAFHYVFTGLMAVRNLEALALCLLRRDPYADLRPSLLLYRPDELSLGDAPPERAWLLHSGRMTPQ